MQKKRVYKRSEYLLCLGRYCLKDLAYELGLLKGNLNYTKFIILGRGRSGSNFLRGLLNSHSQITVFGEIFRFYDSIGWEFPEKDRFSQSPKLLKLIQNDPVSFLQKKVFKNYSKQTVAVGFKLFYYHAWKDSRKAIWPFLKQQKDLKIIHIKRINTLKQLLSEKIALKSNIWTNYTGEHEEKMFVKLDYDECLEMFIRVQKERDQGDTYFKNHDKIDVVYEDLSRNYVREVKRIQEFLNVAHENLKPNTHKQAHQPLHEAILNYSSLKKKFKGTPWYAFFED